MSLVNTQLSTSRRKDKVMQIMHEYVLPVILIKEAYAFLVRKIK